MAANMRFVPRNLIEDVRLTLSSNGSPLLSVDNLKNAEREDIYRIAAGSSIEISGNWGGDAVRASMAAMLRHNLDVEATWRVVFYPNSDLTGTPLYDSTAVAAVSAVALGDLDFGIDPLGFNVYDPYLSYKQSQVWGVAAGYAIKSFKITISNPDNVDGVINIARLIIGHFREVEFNPEVGLKVGWQAETTIVVTESGYRYADAGSANRRLSFDLKYISEADRIAWMEATRFLAPGKSMFLSVLPEDSSAKRIRDLSGEWIIQTLPDLMMETNHASTSMTLIEA